MKAADRIIQGLQEALQHARGEKDSGVRLHIPERINVSAIRRKAGLSQSSFAGRIGVSAATLRNWEQGRRNPEGAARVLLAMLAQNPHIVEETLGK
jgi:putative transcriptional regulator